jgi:hypothetical protein
MARNIGEEMAVSVIIVASWLNVSWRRNERKHGVMSKSQWHL